ncbi:MAG: hypothetical protein O7B35_10510 [Deltaproteobacteria bacterium]|nr:hypothetical protein [Deltaproteobacteria bacterium]
MNEEENRRHFHASLKTVLKRNVIIYEMSFIDGGGTNGPQEFMKDLIEKRGWVSIVTFCVTLGKYIGFQHLAPAQR